MSDAGEMKHEVSEVMREAEAGDFKIPPGKDILRNPEQYKPRRKQMKFTPKQERFIQLYVYHDLTNTECAHRAGYSFPAIAATKMLNDPRYTHIQGKIQEMKDLEQRKYEITFEKVARDLQKIRDAAMEDGRSRGLGRAYAGRVPSPPRPARLRLGSLGSRGLASGPLAFGCVAAPKLCKP